MELWKISKSLDKLLDMTKGFKTVDVGKPDLESYKPEAKAPEIQGYLQSDGRSAGE